MHSDFATFRISKKLASLVANFLVVHPQKIFQLTSKVKIVFSFQPVNVKICNATIVYILFALDLSFFHQKDAVKSDQVSHYQVIF